MADNADITQADIQLMFLATFHPLVGVTRQEDMNRLGQMYPAIIWLMFVNPQEFDQLLEHIVQLRNQWQRALDGSN